jgi:hypothetical protein
MQEKSQVLGGNCLKNQRFRKKKKLIKFFFLKKVGKKKGGAK